MTTDQSREARSDMASERSATRSGGGGWGSMSDLGAFDVFNRLVEQNDKAIKMAPLENVSHLKKVKAGTQVTIGVAGDEVGAIFEGKYVGGLILCERKRYDQVKAEMEAERVETQNGNNL